MSTFTKIRCRTAAVKWVYGDLLEKFTWMTEKAWNLLGLLYEYNPGEADHSVHATVTLAGRLYEWNRLPNGQKYRLADLLSASGISPERVLLAMLLHDVGKTKLCKELLFKKEELTWQDVLDIRKHQEYSKEMLQAAGLHFEAELAGSHHNYTGGIPEGTLTFWFPALKRRFPVRDLLQLADTRDALTRKRVYKPGFSLMEALTIQCMDALKGQTSPELTCLWIRRDLTFGFRIELDAMEVQDKKVTSNAEVANSFLKTEWAGIKAACNQSQVTRYLPKRPTYPQLAAAA